MTETVNEKGSQTKLTFKNIPILVYDLQSGKKQS